MLRAYAATKREHNAILDSFTTRHRAAVLQAWREWSARRRHLQEVLEVSLERSRLRSLSRALHQWRKNAHATALLRRVFSSACERWRLSCGAAGYEAEFALLQGCFAAWQLATHMQLEDRRRGMLQLAAEGLRERHLLSTAFRALRNEAAWTRDRESYQPLARAALVAWRILTAASEARAVTVATRRHCDLGMLQRSFMAWRNAATAVACRVSVFYLKWQNDSPMRRALKAWQAAVAETKKWEALRAEAEAMRSRHASPATIPSLSPVLAMQSPPRGVSPGVAVWSTPASAIVVSSSSRHVTEMTWVLTKETAKRTAATHSSGAHSIGPVNSQSHSQSRGAASEVWQARAEEWRQRQALYLSRGSHI